MPFLFPSLAGLLGSGDGARVEKTCQDEGGL